MALIKWRKSTGEWATLYANAILNRLRVDKNLADIKDKQAARENLELTGDNNHTHYHDDRYVPMINAAKDYCKSILDGAVAKLQKNMKDLISGLNKSIIELSGDASGKGSFNAQGTTMIKTTVNHSVQSDKANNADEATHSKKSDEATIAFNIPTKDVGGNIWIE